MFNPNRINGFSKLLGVTLLSAALFGCGNDDKAAAPDAKADAKLSPSLPLLNILPWMQCVKVPSKSLVQQVIKKVRT